MAEPYHGKTAVLATQHGKQAAIGPALQRLGLSLVVPEGINTDALGTFTGEVERKSSMQETAREKARLGMRASGLRIGIASEGSFGPHPELGFIPAAREIIHFIDETRGIEVSEGMASVQTNYASLELREGADVEGFLTQAGFPSHGLILRGPGLLMKGITSRQALEEGLAQARGLADCVLETDMRAHMNPTRMAEIARLAERLAARLLTPCPACAAPGFGPVAETRGLACRDCGAPTLLIRDITHGCSACGHEQHQPRPDGMTRAEPQYCPECNP